MRPQFIGPEDGGYQTYALSMEIAAENTLYWPYTRPEDYEMYVDVEQIPHGELGIHRGAHVEATDGRVGKVDEFIINPDNNHISHIVLQKEHLWGKKDVSIPVSEISRLEDDVVHLKLSKKEVQQLPSIPATRL